MVEKSKNYLFLRERGEISDGALVWIPSDSTLINENFSETISLKNPKIGILILSRKPSCRWWLKNYVPVFVDNSFWYVAENNFYALERGK